MNKKKSPSLVSGLMPGLVLGTCLTAGGITNVLAQDYYLVAKEFTKLLPDGSQVKVWGFAEDADSDLTTVGSEVATAPGPELRVNPTDQTLRVHVRNDLTTEGVSIVIPGQKMPWTSIGSGPTWTDGTTGARADDLSVTADPLKKRVRSFGVEAGPGQTVTYEWSALRNNPIKSGSYLYHSGTHPQVQVQMGLYGAMIKDESAGNAYAGQAYDNEVILFYSELDPVMHNAIAGALVDDPATVGIDESLPSYGPGKAVTSTIDYNPKFFFVNGENYDPAISLAGGDTGTRSLVRMFNAGFESHAPMLVGMHMNIIAEDGKAYPHQREQYSVRLAALKSKDAIISSGVAGDFSLFDRVLNLSDGPSASMIADAGGLISNFRISVPVGAPVATDDHVTVAENGTINDLTPTVAPGILVNDSSYDAASIALISGPLNATSFVLNNDGSYNYVHNGSEIAGDSFTYSIGNISGTSQATVNISVTPVNDLPVANADIATTNDRHAVTVNVLNNDTDAENDLLSVIATSHGTDGFVTTNGTTVKYTPATVATAAGYVDNFTYTITDGSPGTAIVGNVTVNVSKGFNRTPKPKNDYVTSRMNRTHASLDILGNDTDDRFPVNPAEFADPAPLPDIAGVGEVKILGRRVKNAAGVNLPLVSGHPVRVTKRGGQVVYNGDGTVSYTPRRFFRGTDIFKYKLIDKQGKVSRKATVRINVVR